MNNSLKEFSYEGLKRNGIVTGGECGVLQGFCNKMGELYSILYADEMI